VSAALPMTVSVTAPAAFDPDEITRPTVTADGVPVVSITPDADALARVDFSVTGRTGYELEVTTEGPRSWDSAVGSVPETLAGEEAIEAPGEDLFRSEDPALIRSTVAREGEVTEGDSREWALPVEPFRLLANPFAGGTEPLARRIHPYGFYPLGVAVHAALSLSPGARPLEADIRWRTPMTGGAGFRLRLTIARADDSRIAVDARFFEAGVERAEMTLTLERPAPK
jgi:hypothetical protein